MLQERINQCRVLMSEVSQNKQKDQENQNIARKNNTFFDTYNNYYVPLMQSYIVARTYKQVEFSEKVNSEISKITEYTKKTFEQKTVINPVKYQEGLKKLSDSIEKEWNNQTEQYLSGITEELSILKLVSNEKQEIQKILIGFNNFSKWPVTDDKLFVYENAYEQANNMLENMKFDKEISEFLKKIKNKEATLLDLTDPIREWITRENLAGNIMLNIRN